MLDQILETRSVEKIRKITPDKWDTLRNEYLDIFFHEEYGQPIPKPETLTFEEAKLSYFDKRFCAGKATLHHVTAHATIDGKKFSFPFCAVLPTKPGKYPFFVLNNFTNGVPDKYLPIEEIIDNGFAVLSVCYEDVTSDNGDFTNGLAAIVTPPEAQTDFTKRAPDAPGKIVMWAWANCRLLDYAATQDCLDMNNAATIGHSRLGKTSLLAGALDTRFRFVISNDAGCSGDAITRGKQGEQISDITTRFPFWFCENYKKYTDHNKLTFDQHELIATVAPRHFLSGAAVEDTWADPEAQLLGCHAASPAWEQLGLKGLISPDRYAEIGETFGNGNVAFHLRSGSHYLSRYDWNVYMNYIKKNLV